MAKVNLPHRIDLTWIFMFQFESILMLRIIDQLIKLSANLNDGHRARETSILSIEKHIYI